ncbi:YdcF family protein [Methylobacter sp. sgz302048]|uniref:YdcF family protein n=1 Tax=Methylobacter sp. sgz302048 TaxID=3455945 RepID=UPI003FA0E591
MYPESKHCKGFKFVVGFCLGTVLVCVIAAYFILQIDYWLVVENRPVNADMIVILGGDPGSRLRKGLNLYDQGFAHRLLLIDKETSAWAHVTHNGCKDCVLDGKNVVILSGSTSTFTDASIVKTYCLEHGIKSLLVVTDPYHTRRVSLTFSNEFKHSNVSFTVISSDDYNFLLSPGNHWWSDPATLEIVWLEMIKCVYVIASLPH